MILIMDLQPLFPRSWLPQCEVLSSKIIILLMFSINLSVICDVSDLSCHHHSDRLSHAHLPVSFLSLIDRRRDLRGDLPISSDRLSLCCRPGGGLGPRGLWEPRLLLDLHLWQTHLELCWSYSHRHTGMCLPVCLMYLRWSCFVHKLQ